MTDADTLAKLNAPAIMALHVDLDDAVVIRDALAGYRSPIPSNMAVRDCLLELVQEKIDRATAAEDLPDDWLAQQYAACGLVYGG
jgi:hypothetical protein